MTNDAGRLDAEIDSLKESGAHSGSDGLLKALSRLPKFRAPAVALNVALVRVAAVMKGKADAASRPGFARGFRAAALAAAACLLVAAGVVYVRSAGSLPGERLYPVKLMRENLAARLMPGDKQNVAFHLARADNRLKELKKVTPGSVQQQAAVEMVHRHASEAVRCAYNVPEEEADAVFDQLELLHRSEREAFSNMRLTASPRQYEYYDNNIKLCDDRMEWISQLRR